MHSVLTNSNRKDKTLIVGLGNTLLSDDGTGIYLVRELEKVIDNPDIVIREASMGGLELIDVIAGYKRVVLINAVLSENQSVGTLIRLGINDIKGGSSWTRHQVSLDEAVRLANKVNMNITSDIRIYGVVVKDISTFNENCTPEVSSSLPGLVKSLKQKILSME